MLRSKTYFAAGRRFVRAGDLLPQDDPIVKGREHLFEPIGTAKKASPKKAVAKKATSTPAAAKPKADDGD